MALPQSTAAVKYCLLCSRPIWAAQSCAEFAAHPGSMFHAECVQVDGADAARDVAERAEFAGFDALMRERPNA